MLLIENQLYVDDLKRVLKSIELDKDISILLTGATGLVGSFLTDVFWLYNKTSRFNICVTLTSRNYEKLQKRFPYLLQDDNFKMLERNVEDHIGNEEKYDYIINAASNADPGTYAKYPVETIKTNILGTINVLEYAKCHSNTRVLFTSTMEVYGKGIRTDSFKENQYGLIDYNEIRSCYPESKRTSELLMRSYAEEYHCDIVIARLGYIYGPTMTKTDNKVVAQFINNALEKRNIILKSSGEQKRSYCYIADTVLGILTVLFKGRSGEAYNIANEQSVITISELAEKAAEINHVKVEYAAPSALEKKGFSSPQDAILNTEKLQELGFAPYYSIKEGLERTVLILSDVRR